MAASLAFILFSYVGWQVLKPVATTEPSVVVHNSNADTSLEPEKPAVEGTPMPTHVPKPLPELVAEHSPGTEMAGGGSKTASMDFPGGSASGTSSDSSHLITSSAEWSTSSPPLTTLRMQEDRDESFEQSTIPQPTSSISSDSMLASQMIKEVDRVPEPKKRKSVNVSWIALGYSSGNFQQSILAGSPDAGVSRYSVVYFGRNIGRLSIFSGLALSEQEYNSISNLTYGNTSARKALSTDMVGPLTTTADLSASNTYKVNTQKRYLSVPVQIGWFLVDRKIKGMISLGVMSDYFLTSTVSDVSGIYLSSSIRRSSKSSYAGWVFSGLATTDWSWSVAGRYQIALSPGLRYALTPVYKKESVSNGKSVSADIGLRLRYFF